MKLSSYTLVICGGLLAAVVCCWANNARDDDDVIYLIEHGQETIRLHVSHRAPLTLSRNPASVIAYLAEGQLVEVLGLGEKQDFVSARIPTGVVEGWVSTRDLEPVPLAFLTKLREQVEQGSSHPEAGSPHDVSVGMTREEVRASLGKPDEVSRTVATSTERWFYTTYRYLPSYLQSPDKDGTSRRIVTYHREPAGRKVITFQRGRVVDIGEPQGADHHGVPGAAVSTVP